MSGSEHCVALYVPPHVGCSGCSTPGHTTSSDLAGRSTILALPCSLLCFGNSVNRKWTENKNVTISDRFICFILTVKQSAVLAACVLRTTLEKGRQLFKGKKCTPEPEKILAMPMPPQHSASVPPNVKSWLCLWLWVRMFWPRNDLARLLRWLRHWSPVWQFNLVLPMWQFVVHFLLLHFIRVSASEVVLLFPSHPVLFGNCW